MPVVSTDDSSRRLRNVWLGPKGYRLPDARFEAWGLFLALLAIFASVGVWFAPTFRLDMTLSLLSVVPAVVITRWVMRRAEHDTPLRYWRDTLVAEVRTPRPHDTTQEREISLSPSLFKEPPR